MEKMTSKNIILTKKFNDVLYEMMVKTNSDMVYVEDDKTLTEKINEFTKLLTDNKQSYTELEEGYNKIVEDAPSSFNTFKEVWDYVNASGDPKSELLKLIDSKQDKEEGKGLSTHDLTDLLHTKLVELYSKEELDQKFSDITGSSSTLTERVETIEKKLEVPEDSSVLPTYDCYFKVLYSDK